MDAVTLSGVAGGIVGILGFFGLSGHVSIRSTVEETHEQVHPNHGTSFRDEVLREVQTVGRTAQRAATSAALAAQRAEDATTAIAGLANRQGADERKLAEHIGWHAGAAR